MTSQKLPHQFRRYISIVAAIQASCSAPVRYYPDDDAGVGGERGTVGGSSNTVSSTGGRVSIGGNSATGGSLAVAGASSTGGSPATGGTPAMGGFRSTGGVQQMGGSIATGGVFATGGASPCPAAVVCDTCLDWNFETGGTSIAPWLLDAAPNSLNGGNGATNAVLSHSKYRSADTSLAVPVLIDQSTNFAAEVAVSTCKSGTAVSLAGYELTGWIFLSGPEITFWGDSLRIETWGPSGLADSYVLFWGSAIPIGTWFPITAPFLSGTPVNRIGLSLNPSINWPGTLYIDDVAVNLKL